jgi:heme-degrading monooxygenase HmoA
MQENITPVYVSITGLKVKNIFASFMFWRHAIPSKAQADRSTGLVSLDVKRAGSYHFTLTVWKNREAMIAYRNSGAHLAAMTAFRKIATGKIYGYETRSIPTWDEALGLWDENAREA